MSKSKLPPCLQSWIPPSFAWISTPDTFAVRVRVDDPDIVSFVANGAHDIDVVAPRKFALAMAKALGMELLRDKLLASAWDSKRLKPSGTSLENGTILRAYCHGLFCLPEQHSLLVLVCFTPTSHPNIWQSSELVTQAQELYTDHLKNIEIYEEEKRQKLLSMEDLCKKSPDLRSVMDKVGWLTPPENPPVLEAKILLPLIAKAAIFNISSKVNLETINRCAISAIESSGWLPERDGCYEGIICRGFEGGRLSVISWEPYNGLTAYPELRWAIQRGLTRAMYKPRMSESSRPEFQFEPMTDDKLTSITGISVDHFEPLEDIHLDDTDFRNRVIHVKNKIAENGFEAIAWFQPFHKWSEETWGIYFDSRLLDNLALYLIEEFRSRRIQATSDDAARIAFGLIYAHELFHAKVEAVSSWLEVSFQQPRFMKYSKQVYEVLRDTPEWLEEALANWSSWHWFQSAQVQESFKSSGAKTDDLQKVVEDFLDFSPPGYRDWRLGDQPIIWRKFANQLATGRPRPKKQLPLESILRKTCPFDFRESDIPLRFVGDGVIANRLLSHPANFNVPTLREVEKALKFFKHILDPSGGKGGHQKWIGPDQRAFILPTRDPLSIGVFKSFLNYLGIDKSTYVREIRPKI